MVEGTVVYEIPLWLYPFVIAAMAAPVWAMFRMADSKNPGCGWVGHDD